MTEAPSKSAQIVQYYFDGLTYRRIAAQVGVSIGRVTSTLSRARRTGRISSARRPRGSLPRGHTLRRKVGGVPDYKVAGKRTCTKCRQVKQNGPAWPKQPEGACTGRYHVCKKCIRAMGRADYKAAKRRFINA